MSKLVTSAIVAATLLVGATALQAQTRSIPRDASVDGVQATSVARRCAGIGCLQGVPSLGVGF